MQSASVRKNAPTTFFVMRRFRILLPPRFPRDIRRLIVLYEMLRRDAIQNKTAPRLTGARVRLARDYLEDIDLIFRRVMARMRATLLCPMVPS